MTPSRDSPLPEHALFAASHASRFSHRPLRKHRQARGRAGQHGVRGVVGLCPPPQHAAGEVVEADEAAREEAQPHPLLASARER